MASDGHEREDVGARDPDAASLSRDADLVHRTRQGDMEAYGELVRHHMRRAFSIAYNVLRHREDAEDVVQESFARTLERIHRMDQGKPFHPWFYRIVVNEAISQHRRRSLRISTPNYDELESSGPAPDRRVELNELRDRLLLALDALPENRRTIVMLADVEELSSREISSILEMPPGTVRYHLHLGRRALREALSVAREEEKG